MPHHPTTLGDVAQLVRAPACHAGGCGFEPRHPRFDQTPGNPGFFHAPAESLRTCAPDSRAGYKCPKPRGNGLRPTGLLARMGGRGVGTGGRHLVVRDPSLSTMAVADLARGPLRLHRIRLKPSHADLAVLDSLRMALSDLGRLDRAGAHLARLVAIEPENANGWVALGVVRARERKASEAVAAPRRSLQIEPNNDPAAEDGPRGGLRAPLPHLPCAPDAGDQGDVPRLDGRRAPDVPGRPARAEGLRPTAGWMTGTSIRVVDAASTTTE